VATAAACVGGGDGAAPRSRRLRPRCPGTAGFDWTRISSEAATEATAVAVAAAGRVGDGDDDGGGTATTTTRTKMTVAAGAVTLRPPRLACFGTGARWPDTTVGRGRSTCGIGADGRGPAWRPRTLGG